MITGTAANPAVNKAAARYRMKRHVGVFADPIGIDRVIRGNGFR
jgi:hypothetical protein